MGIESLRLLNDGEPLEEANEALLAIVTAVRWTTEGGEINLKIKIKGEGKSGMVSTEATIAVKQPKRPAHKMTYFVAKDGALSLSSERQATFLAEVPDDDNAERGDERRPLRGNRLNEGEQRRAE